jgi:hypothetical protein
VCDEINKEAKVEEVDWIEFNIDFDFLMGWEKERILVLSGVI